LYYSADEISVVRPSSAVPVMRPLRSRAHAQRDLTRGAFGDLSSCFARRAASVFNDRAILSNFFLTRGSVAWLAKFRHFSAISRYSKPFRILPLLGIANPRHGTIVAGGSVRGGKPSLIFPHPERDSRLMLR